MPRTEVPLIPVFTRWFRSWRGVGTGAFSLALGQVWCRLVALTAVDISPAMVVAAEGRFCCAGITARVIRAGGVALPLADASFDLVIAAHVLEHLPEPVAALADMRRVLRLGGWVVTCMTRQSWFAYFEAKWRTHRLTRGLFRLTSLNAIEHNASAGIAGKELNT